MKKNIRVLSMFILFSFTATFFSGCGTAAPKQALLEAINQNKTIKSSQIKGEAKLEFTPSKNLSSQESKNLLMLNNAKLTWDGVIQKSPEKAILNLGINVQGISMEGTIYFKDDKAYLKLPAILLPSDKYLEVDLKEVYKNSKKDSNNYQQNQELAQSLILDLYQSIKEDKFKDGDKKDLNDEKARIIKLELANDDLINLLHKVGELITSDKYKGLLNTSSKSTKSPQDIKKEFNQNLTEMQKDIKFEKFITTVTLDKKGYNRSEDIELSIRTIKDNNILKIKAHSSVNDIDKTPEFNFPDFNKNNTIPIKDFSQANPFLGGLGQNSPGEPLLPGQSSPRI